MTKKILRSSLILVLLSACVFPFGRASSAFADEFGVLGGVNFASFSISSPSVSGSVSSDTKTRVTGGLLYSFDLDSMFTLQPELRYIDKSAGTSTFGMLILPVMLQLNVPTGSSVSPHFGVGPDLGFKLSGSGAKSIDFAADFGAGVDFALDSGTRLALDFRYSLGLVNVLDVTTLEAKTRGIHLMFGVKFPIGGALASREGATR